MTSTGGEPKYLDKNVSQRHIFRNESHIDYAGF